MNVCAEQEEKRPTATLALVSLREGGDKGDAFGWDSGSGKEAFPPFPLGEQTYLGND